jgi:transposase
MARGRNRNSGAHIPGADGHGRAAFDPEMIVALLLYAYAIDERSSRAIERRCHVDIAFPCDHG